MTVPRQLLVHARFANQLQPLGLRRDHRLRRGDESTSSPGCRRSSMRSAMRSAARSAAASRSARGRHTASPARSARSARRCSAAAASPASYCASTSAARRSAIGVGYDRRTYIGAEGTVLAPQTGWPTRRCGWPAYASTRLDERSSLSFNAYRQLVRERVRSRPATSIGYSASLAYRRDLLRGLERHGRGGARRGRPREDLPDSMSASGLLGLQLHLLLTARPETTPMFDEFYGLTGKPFQLTPDPAFYFRSTTHREGAVVPRLRARRRARGSSS